MGRLLNIALTQLIDYLAQEGDRLAKQALASKETKNRSFNQADAFGYVVYFNKKAVRKGYASPTPMSNSVHKGWETVGITAGTGREWLDEFIESWIPENMGFVLIVVNAAFYSSIQEQGRGTLKRNYQIVSQLWGEMENIQKQFKGSTIALKNAYPR